MECAETPGDRAREHVLVWTVVVAGGSGRRFGRAKQYESLGDQRVIDVSRATAAQCSDGVVLVVPADDASSENGVAGGETRSASVRAGLARVPEDVDVVCVHDAARPLASPALYERVVAAILDGADAAVPGIAVADTIKVIDPASALGNVLGRVTNTPDRSTLVAVQTPQAFRASALRAAHASGGDATDDAALVEAAGGVVVVVEGEPSARKITTPDDLGWAREQLVRSTP
ncbi:MAG: 2-C-methyl-D-erythritol 4-phosphate cytidylyltransferase [Ilumatobacter sp.]